MTIKPTLLLLLFFLYSNHLSAQFFTENFDGASPNIIYTNGPCNDGENDFFDLITLDATTGCATNASSDFCFVGGNGQVLAAQDTDDELACASSNEVSALINDIDISSSTAGNLYLCFDIAEDDSGDGEEDWDGNAYVSIAYDLDNAGENNDIIAFAGTGQNTQPSLDADCDETGDGITFITSTFTTFCVYVHINGNESLMDIIINIENLNSGDEDVAFDNFRLYNTSNPAADLPAAITPTCHCPLNIIEGIGLCNTFTAGNGNDTWDVQLGFTGGATDIYNISPNSGTVSFSPSDPNSESSGTFSIINISEGTDLSFNITSPNGCAVDVAADSPVCESCNNMPQSGASANIDIKMDLSTQAAANAAPDDFHTAIMNCASGEYNAAYGELLSSSGGEGIIQGLYDETGQEITGLVNYKIGDVTPNCPEDGIYQTLTGSISGVPGTMQSGSPKPNLFASHFTENSGQFDGLNSIEITFTDPVSNFGFFLGDVESSNQGRLGKVAIFDANDNLIASKLLDPIANGPITDESGCGENQGNMNCGNGTTTWIGITNAIPPIKKVLLVVGDDDNCAQTSACTGLTERISFGGITVGGICFGSLPVSLVSFEVRPLAVGQAILNWSTATEEHNDFFQIERSTNGSDFAAIGRVDGYGNSTTTKTYTFIDENLGSGNYYYRLRQVDFDGSFSFSPIRAVAINTEHNIRIFPTLVHKNIAIESNISPQNNLTFKILNAYGQLVQSGKIAAASNLTTIDLSHLPAGNYYVQVLANKNRRSIQRFVKL
ncbi:MAG: T9SS type A sorting domain-containing protein [Bacteroidota bacterium]